MTCRWTSRNPHDIGRRILRHQQRRDPRSGLVAILMTLEGEYYKSRQPVKQAQTSRNPHDIGRRILPMRRVRPLLALKVAILMTLEGEYYPNIQQLGLLNPYSRNPHDIGRRILPY